MYERKEPAATVGFLREKVMMESLIAFIERIVTNHDPKGFFKEYSEKIAELFGLRSFIKHMRGMLFNEMKPMRQ